MDSYDKSLFVYFREFLYNTVCYNITHSVVCYIITHSIGTVFYQIC